MHFPENVYPESMSCDDSGALSIDGISVAQLASDFGTPVMIYAGRDVVEVAQEFSDVFDRVLYASKAAPIIGLEKLLFERGIGCDVSTLGELEVALRAGCSPELIVMHGNNKSDEEIRRCIEARISRIVIEDEHECDRIERIASDLGVSNVDVELRLTPGIEAHTHEAIMTGAIDSKFGNTIEFGTAANMVDRIVHSSVLELRGFHCHIGSQIFDTEPLAQAARVCIEFYVELREKYVSQDIELNLNEINIGGGFGIHYQADDDPPLPIDMARAVRAAAHEVCQQHGVHDLEIWAEPGRALVGRAGVTIYTVGSVKVIPNTRTYVAVDGGMGDNIRPAIYGAKHACWVDGRNGNAVGESLVTIAGKHCEEGDVLAKDVSLPGDIAVDDVLVMASTGAYSFAMSSNYNMLTRPAVVLVDSGADHPATVIVRRETMDDMLARMI